MYVCIRFISLKHVYAFINEKSEMHNSIPQKDKRYNQLDLEHTVMILIMINEYGECISNHECNTKNEGIT